MKKEKEKTEEEKRHLGNFQRCYHHTMKCCERNIE